jgi:site-specific recombinase XerD
MAFGAGTPLARITAAKISEYRDSRLGATLDRTHRPLTAAAVNRPLALLRGLMTLARDEWELLSVAPKIKLAAEPQARIRWLDPDEEARLLAACDKSQTRHLRAVVTVAMETGLRASCLDLTWDRVDLSRGVLPWR